MSEWNVQGDNASAVQILDANVLNILGETDIETESVIELGVKKLKITHSDVENRITEDNVTLTSGGEFDAIDFLTVSSQGHVTGVNTKTYTLPSTIGGSGTNNTIAMFDTAQGDSLGDSIISQNPGATSVTINGALTVTNVSSFTGGISANGGITVGSGDSIDTPSITINNLLSLDGRLELNGEEGTSGQYLKSQGANTPVWDTLSLNDLSDASTPSTNLLIGSNASMQGTENNQTVIGINAQGNGPNTVTIGNYDVTAVKLGGPYTSLGASGTGIGKLFDRTNSFGTTGDLLSCDFDTGSEPGGIKWITPDYVSGKTAGSPNVAVTEIRTLTQTEYNALTSSNIASITYATGTTSYSLSPITQAAIGNGTLVVTKSGVVFDTVNYNISGGNLVLTSTGVGNLTDGDVLVATLSPTASIMYVIIGTSPSP
jgi:hypothetical protein